ncbi:YheU family protein [Pseudomonadota bacterium]
MLKIPWDQLSQEVLHSLIEEFITREGTDYGEREFSLAEKVEQVKAQIKNGKVVIVFDEKSGSCNLLPNE